VVRNQELIIIAGICEIVGYKNTFPVVLEGIFIEPERDRKRSVQIIKHIP